MASSLLKKVRIRTSRCEFQLLELRAECVTTDDQRRLDAVVAIQRQASSRIDAVMLGIEAAMPADLPANVCHVSQPQQPPARLPAADAAAVAAAPAPVYGPSTGVREARAPELTGMARDFQKDNDTFRPARQGLTADEQADEIVQGVRGGSYEHDAAARLVLDLAWKNWTGDEKLAAIEKLAREIEAGDDTDYLVPGEPKRGPGAYQPAAAVTRDDGHMF